MNDTGAAGSWNGRIALLALVATSGVAVIYVPQPIQTLVAAEFGVSIADSALANVAVQAGYALGVLLLVSLSDRFSARSQITLQLVATAGALTAAALAPSHGLYVAMCFVAGATATVGQILIAMALRLAPPAARARIAAVLIGSFLVGLFSVRTALGALAELAGWRAVVLGVAVILLALVPVCRSVVPRNSPASPPSAREILLSIPRIARVSPGLQLVTTMHTLCFAAFIGSWTLSTVHAVQVLEFSVASAALLGLAGLAGGATTIAVAPLHHRIGARRSFLFSLASLIVGTAMLTAASGEVAMVVGGLYLVSLGLSSGQVSTQARALASVAPHESGRANTVFVTITFLGGALATAVADAAYRWGGFSTVGALSLVYVVLASLVTALAIRRGVL